MSNRNLLRQGETMIAVESAPAIVNFDDILGATKVVYDTYSNEAPWDSCDGFEHTCTPARRFNFDPSDMRGYCDGGREQIVIQLPKGEDWGTYAHFREHGASRQVAAEMVALNRRRTLDQLVKWYSDGWQWYGVKCDFEILGEEFNDSIWGIDDADYATYEIRPEIADNIAAELEEAGFTVTGRPARIYPTRQSKQARIYYNLQLQNWKN